MLSVNGLLLKIDKSNMAQVVSRIQMAVTTSVDNVDPKTTCRFCLVKQDPADLFCLFGSNKMFEDLSIASAILDCFNIELLYDKTLPNYVCIKCASSTLQTYTFKQCLKKSQGYLEKWQSERILEEDAAEESTIHEVMEEVVSEAEEENEEELNEEELNEEELEETVDEYFLPDSDEYAELPLLHILAEHDYCNKENEEGEVEDEEYVEQVEDGEEAEDKLEVIEETETDPQESEGRWWSKELGPPYNCKICGRAYGVRFRAFYVHVRMHYAKKVQCIYCDKRYSHGKMAVHMRTHTNERPFACDVCPARFNAKGNLNRHLLSHTDQKIYTCDICGKSFAQSTSLYSHKELHTKINILKCEYCEETFNSGTHYTNHLKLHQVELEGIELYEKNSVEDREEELTEQMICNVCGKGFNTAAALGVHAQIHTDSRRFHCNLCVKRFNSHFNFRIHTLWHELTMDPSDDLDEWRCEICEQKFEEKNPLVAHILTHMERPFLCSICGKTYVTKMALLHHSRAHNEDKPFICDICSKAFRSSATLKQHYRIHTGEKPHKCGVCFRNFAQQQQLMSHLLTHTGEKKYVCPFCGKAFALNGNLTVHKRRHTGETPYVCDVCGKGFYDSSTLKKHRRGQHKNVAQNLDVEEMLTKLEEETI